MIKQFVQVSATKDSNNFAFCSNLSLMGNGWTYKQALRELQVMADDYSLNGYKIEWIVEDMSDEEFALYKFSEELFA
jgi:hypothetical protein